jgi:regulator of nonsense transcripts 1
MDTFDNFQYESASSYGGMGVVDDNSSVYTVSTTQNAPSTLDLDALSLADERPPVSLHHHHQIPTPNGALSEDFDAVLDDLKDEGNVDLPPHACWCVLIISLSPRVHPRLQLLWYSQPGVGCKMSRLPEVVL